MVREEFMEGCYFFVWGGKLNNKKITTIKLDVAFDGCHSYTHNNQQKTHGRDGGGMGYDAQPGGDNRGAQFHHFGGN
jgi:hypothetical protein